MSDPSQPLPDLLRAWRGVDPATGRGRMSQSEAADFLGMPLKTYQGIEQGRSTAKDRAIRKQIKPQ